MITDQDTSHAARPEDDLYPCRTVCRSCGAPFRHLVLDRQYCSYACAGVAAPDCAGDRPATCWTWDGKPKMCFFTPALAESMREGLDIPGVVSYYCGIHHLWHIGYELPH